METPRCVRTRRDARVKAVSSRAFRLNCPEYRLPVGASSAVPQQHIVLKRPQHPEQLTLKSSDCKGPNDSNIATTTSAPLQPGRLQSLQSGSLDHYKDFYSSPRFVKWMETLISPLRRSHKSESPVTQDQQKRGFSGREIESLKTQRLRNLNKINAHSARARERWVTFRTVPGGLPWPPGSGHQAVEAAFENSSACTSRNCALSRSSTRA